MNIIEKILGIRLLDGVLQFTNSNKWKPLVNSVDNRTTGFALALSDIGKYIRVNSSDQLCAAKNSSGTVTMECGGSLYGHKSKNSIMSFICDEPENVTIKGMCVMALEEDIWVLNYETLPFYYLRRNCFLNDCVPRNYGDFTVRP